MDAQEPRRRSKRARAGAAESAAVEPGHPRPEPGARPRQVEPAIEIAHEALEREGLPAERPLFQGGAAVSRPPSQAGDDPLLEFFYRADESVGELADLAPAVAAEDRALPEEVPRELLAFLLAGEDYAVELQRVREIVKVPSITEVPRAPLDVRGIMSLRGDVIPVFDVRRRLGLPALRGEPSRDARVVIVDLADGRVGILVDAVAQVVRLRPSTIEPTPPGLGGAEAEYLAGIGRLKDRFFILLNLDALLALPTTAGRERA